MYKCAKVRKDTKKSVQKCVKSEKNLEKKQKLPQNMRKMAPKFKEFMKMCGKIIFRKKIEGDKIKKCKKNAIMGKEWDNGQKNWDWGNHKKKKTRKNANNAKHTWGTYKGSSHFRAGGDQNVSVILHDFPFFKKIENYIPFCTEAMFCFGRADDCLSILVIISGDCLTMRHTKKKAKCKTLPALFKTWPTDGTHLAWNPTDCRSGLSLGGGDK